MKIKQNYFAALHILPYLGLWAQFTILFILRHYAARYPRTGYRNVTRQRHANRQQLHDGQLDYWLICSLAIIYYLEDNISLRNYSLSYYTALVVCKIGKCVYRIRYKLTTNFLLVHF
jgi:hypothetical protein